MDFNALQYFLMVAQHGSITRAAIRLNLTQPAVSRRIKRLEEEFETPLLYRHGRGVSLTDAGIRVRDAAQEAFTNLGALKEDLSGVGQLRGEVKLGLPPSLGASLSVLLARSFRQRFPEARLRIVEGFSGSLFEWLEAGRVDIAVLYDARRSPTMLVKPLLHEDLFLVQRADSGYSQGPASITDLADGTFALSSSSNGLRRVIDSCASRAGISIAVAIEVDSLAALKQIVEQGPERSILPMGAIYREVKAGRLIARQLSEAELRPLLVTAAPLHQQITRLTKQTEVLLLEQVASGLEIGIISGSITDLGEA